MLYVTSATRRGSLFTVSNHITSHLNQKYGYCCFCRHRTLIYVDNTEYGVCQLLCWALSPDLRIDFNPQDGVEPQSTPVEANSRVKPSHDPDNLNQTGGVTNSHPSPPAAPRPPSFWQEPRTRPPASKEGDPVSHHSHLSHLSKLFRGC